VQSAAIIERDDFKVVPRPVPLATLLTDAEAYAETLEGGHPVEFAISSGLDGQEQVWADPERVGQVLRNLLSNAAKYSLQGESIELRAKRIQQRILRIEVADHGIGIRPDDQVRIFEKFGRGRDQEGRKVAGVGLGLYLSRRIIRSHGSELTVYSAPGEGSVFGFELEVVR
jgi:signal transduction histidine kinase